MGQKDDGRLLTLALGVSAWALWDAFGASAPQPARFGQEAGDTGVPLLPAYSVKRGVVMTERLSGFAGALAEATGLYFNVRSGVRTSYEQAAAMLRKFNLGEDLTRLYGEKARVLLGLTPDVATWGAAIEGMRKRGILFSEHMTRNAFDIDYTALSPEDIDALEETAQDLGATTLREAVPPHLHIVVPEEEEV